MVMPKNLSEETVRAPSTGHDEEWRKRIVHLLLFCATTAVKILHGWSSLDGLRRPFFVCSQTRWLCLKSSMARRQQRHSDNGAWGICAAQRIRQDLRAEQAESSEPRLSFRESFSWVWSATDESNAWDLCPFRPPSCHGPLHLLPPPSPPCGRCGQYAVVYDVDVSGQVCKHTSSADTPLNFGKKNFAAVVIFGAFPVEPPKSLESILLYF